jgi:heptaprenyl diphosphate synthase
MVLLKRFEKFKVISVSTAGGIAHNLGQILMAAAVVENSRLFYYFPVLFLAGAVTGILIGTVAQEMLLRLPVERMQTYRKEKP